MEGLKLPGPKDRHVLAAAIKSGAQVIVTRNLKDFPASGLEPWSVEAKSPDAFVLDQIGIDRQVVASAVRQIADSRTARLIVAGRPELGNSPWKRGVRNGPSECTASAAVAVGETDRRPAPGHPRGRAAAAAPPVHPGPVRPGHRARR